MSESLPYGWKKFDRNVKLEDTLHIPDSSDIGFFVEGDLEYTDIVQEKTNNFPFAPEVKEITSYNYFLYMNENK